MGNNFYNIVFKIIYTTSIFFYIISLTQEGFCTVSRCGDNWIGIQLVGMGAIGGILSIAGIVWYANPLLWAGWWFMKKDPEKAFFFSAAATVLSLSFLLFNEIADQTPGRLSYITNYRLGYWLWVSCIAGTFVGSGVLCVVKRKYGLQEERYYPY